MVRVVDAVVELAVEGFALCAAVVAVAVDREVREVEVVAVEARTSPGDLPSAVKI